MRDIADKIKRYSPVITFTVTGISFAVSGGKALSTIEHNEKAAEQNAVKIQEQSRKIEALEIKMESLKSLAKPAFVNLDDPNCRDNLKRCGDALNKYASKVQM